jgi:uncharacterized damage-inducible protein DinB
MATSADILLDALSRVHDNVHHAVDGLTEKQLTFRPGGTGNSIAWLVWHLARVQDDHVAEVAGTEQVWTAKGYAKDFGLPFDAADTGYGHSLDEVGLVNLSAEQLAEYYDAVHEVTETYLKSCTDADLDRVVDDRWDPPVTLGVRLVSVIDDDAQHSGQAAYVRGLVIDV